MTEEPLDASPGTDGLADSEDLFGFDAVATRAQGSGAQGGAAGDDDLFDFDEVLALENAADPVAGDAPAIEVESSDAAGEAERELVPMPPASATDSGAPAAVSMRLPLRSPLALTLVAFAAVNLLLIGFTWKLSNDVRDRVDKATVDLVEATRSMQEKTGEQIELIESSQKPFVSLEPEGGETFRRVEADVAAGDFGSARRRLYALLAVSDRLDAEFREDTVARAEFRLADTLMEQALATEGSRP